jgi:hypothetical protein
MSLDTAVVDRLRQSWVAFYEEVKRPRACVHCEGERVWWNGRRWRSASSRVDGKTVTVPRFPCRRLACGTCERSWTLLPPGLVPGRHFDLTVAAEAVARYLFEEEASREAVAEAFEISSRTLGRFAQHTAHVAEPGLLQKLLLGATGAPILARLEPVRDLARKARGTVQRLVLEKAGQVLCLLEALAGALGCASPGLASLLSRVVAGRRGLTSYREPAVPADAWCAGVGRLGSMPM